MAYMYHKCTYRIWYTVKQNLVRALALSLLAVPLLSRAQITELEDTKAILNGDTFKIETGQIARTFSWNDGNLISREIQDKNTGYKWSYENNKTADLLIPGVKDKAGSGKLTIKQVPGTSTRHAHLVAEVYFRLGELEVKRVFKLYPGSPAIACEYYFRGRTAHAWKTVTAHSADLKNIENQEALKEGSQTIVTDRIKLADKHWKTTAVQFF